MIMFFEIEAARPLRVEDGRAVCADIRGGVERGAFLVPFGHSQRSLFCAAAQGLGHRREASARWAVAAKGGKATRRREQIQGLRADSAQNADICEGAKRAVGAASALRDD